MDAAIPTKPSQPDGIRRDDSEIHAAIATLFASTNNDNPHLKIVDLRIKERIKDSVSELETRVAQHLKLALGALVALLAFLGLSAAGGWLAITSFVTSSVSERVGREAPEVVVKRLLEDPDVIVQQLSKSPEFLQRLSLETHRSLKRQLD